jgi:hypothetical protein
VFCSVEGLVVPQPQTASSSTSNIRIARIFNLPSLNWGSPMRIERCGQGRQWM